MIDKYYNIHLVYTHLSSIIICIILYSKYSQRIDYYYYHYYIVTDMILLYCELNYGSIYLRIHYSLRIKEQEQKHEYY